MGARRYRVMTEADRLLRTLEVSEWLGIPVSTLYQWRYRGVGPRSIRVGRHLRYRPSDVEAWLDRDADGQREDRDA